jgi:predicted ATP-dependent endonuclease of OLD family
MYISKLEICNFRNFENISVNFSPQMNVIIGHNNAGKTNLINALQFIFSYRSNQSRITIDDFNKDYKDFSLPPKISITATITEYKDLPDDRNILFDWVVKHDFPYEAKLSFNYYLPEGDDYASYESDIKECLDENGDYINEKCWILIGKYYLPKYITQIYGGKPERKQKVDFEWLDKFDFQFLDAVRDAEKQILNGNNTLLKHVMNYFLDFDLTVGEKRANLDSAKLNQIKEKEKEFYIKGMELLGLLKGRIRISEILEYAKDKGAEKGGIPNLDSSLSEEQLLFALRLIVEKNGYKIPISNNGLGYNNLLFTALILSKMQVECSSYMGENAKVFPILAIEKPEAHLHPSMQYKFLKFLQENIDKKERVRQIFITTHSTHITSAIDLDNLICLYEDTTGQMNVGYPGKALEDNIESKYYVQRFLDATKSNMLFADRIIFVEGIAEQLLIPCLAAYLNKEELMTKHVAIVSVNGRTCCHFTKIFQYSNYNKNSIDKKIACITDADPIKKVGKNKSQTDANPLKEEDKDKSQWKTCFPIELDSDSNFEYDSLSPHIQSLVEQTSNCENIAIFHPEKGKGKTLEYDLAFFNPSSELLLSKAMPETGRNGRKSLKDMFEKYSNEGSLDEILSSCNNDKIKEKIKKCNWEEEEEKKKALIASVYYQSVKSTKGEHAFLLEKQLRDNLCSPNRKEFKVPTYLQD